MSLLKTVVAKCMVRVGIRSMVTTAQRGTHVTVTTVVMKVVQINGYLSTNKTGFSSDILFVVFIDSLTFPYYPFTFHSTS